MSGKKSQEPKTIKGKVNKTLTGDGRKSVSVTSLKDKILGKAKK